MLSIRISRLVSSQVINFRCRQACLPLIQGRNHSEEKNPEQPKRANSKLLNETHHPNTPLGMMDRVPKQDKSVKSNSPQEDGKPDPYAEFPDSTNPSTGEVNGPKGPEPTRYGDWERKGRVSDF
ncbi:Succinate dehydrogenase assembly factor 4, mitochondrial [Halotydeus destructor]|nr:Succinate dehydrogenase assembly factor 4, mitochondrial [Halotydeus destructor]